MAFFSKIRESLTHSREKLKEQMNVILDRGPALDEEFWDGLEEALILSDLGGQVSMDVVDDLRDKAKRYALPDAYAVLDYLNETIAEQFVEDERDILGPNPACILFVGVNGSGKTTTVGKLSKSNHDAGRTVVLGSADTFRAAAIEQLEAWAKLANVEMCARERGSDPASVCYDTIERAEDLNADLVLIDTAGRLHTSNDLMRELQKVVSVVRKRSKLPVYTVIVIDATTGQNGLSQAREFNRALDLDGVIVTKLDGSAKGGIALAISKELELPILKLGTGEGLDDLKDFDAREYAAGLVGDYGRSDADEAEADEEPEEEATAPASEPEPLADEAQEQQAEEPAEPARADEDFDEDFDEDLGEDEEDFYEIDMEDDFEEDGPADTPLNDAQAANAAPVVDAQTEESAQEVDSASTDSSSAARADDEQACDAAPELSAEDAPESEPVPDDDEAHDDEAHEEEAQSFGSRLKRWFRS